MHEYARECSSLLSLMESPQKSFVLALTNFFKNFCPTVLEKKPKKCQKKEAENFWLFELVSTIESHGFQDWTYGFYRFFLKFVRRYHRNWTSRVVTL